MALAAFSAAKTTAVSLQVQKNAQVAIKFGSISEVFHIVSPNDDFATNNRSAHSFNKTSVVTILQTMRVARST